MHYSSTSHHQSKSAQKGVTLLLTAIFMLTAVLCLALVIDTGRLYYEKRSLQRVADMAALDAASRAGMCGINGSATLTSLAQESATRNGYTEVWGANTVTAGYITLASGLRSFTADSSKPEAVEVVVNKSVPASLVAGGLFGNNVSLRARAVAARNVMAGISAGSNLFKLDAMTSPLLAPLLRGLFGDDVALSLDAVTYNGIANAGVSLKDLLGVNGLDVLATDLTLGAINTALDSQVTLLQVVNASVDVLSEQNALLAAQLSPLLAANIKNAQLTLSDILNVSAAEALDARVNVLDIITAAAFAANKQNAIALNNLGIAVPGLTNITVDLKVIEPPQIAYGKPGESSPGVPNTQVKTAQLMLLTKARLNLAPIAGLDLGLGVAVADGKAWLGTIQCRTLGQPDVVTLHGNTATATLGLGDPAWMDANDSWRDTPGVMSSHPSVLNVLGGLARVKIAGSMPRGSSGNVSKVYTVADRSTNLPLSQNMSSGVPGLSGSLAALDLDVDVEVLGLCLPLICGGLPGDVLNVLTPILAGLVDAVLTPLLTLLGINLNSMDVALTAIDDTGASLVN